MDRLESLSYVLTANQRLFRGVYPGMHREVRRLDLRDFVVREVVYAPGERMPRHAHDYSNVTVVVGGQIDELALYGTIQIEPRDGKLHASMGAMRAELEPFTEPETARVELIPANGEVLRFVFSNGPAPDALKFRDEVFTRVP